MIFLANRSNLQLRRLYRERIANRFESDNVFSDVRFCRAGSRSPGKYRVVTKVDARLFLDLRLFRVEEIVEVLTV